MKVLAIRLAECGRFRTPVALENLSGGLDVVIGRNELGKSTLLRALRLVLTEKHTSANATVRSMRPYNGGTPLIEVELEIDGVRWRLRKRYLAQRGAELTRLDGNFVCRGEDAEEQLVELLDGPSGGGRFPLLWLSQGEALAPLAMERTSRERLSAAIQREVQSIATGDAVSSLLQRVATRLGEVQTSHASPRPRGRYEALLKRKRDVTAAWNTATERATLAAEQLDRLEALRLREADLTNPESAAKLARDIVTARAELEAGREAASRAAEARQAATAAEQKLMAATRDLGDYQRTLASLATLTAALTADEADAAKLSPEITRLRAEIENAHNDAAKQDSLVADLEERHAAAIAAERHHAAASALAKVQRHLAEARALTERKEVIVRDFAAIGASESSVQAARRENNAIAILDAQLAAAATTVTVAYLPASASASRVRVAGRVLNDGEHLETLEPLALEIDGVGRLTVTPSQSTGHDELRADRDAHRSVLGELLACCGVPDLAALEAALDRRRTLDAEAGRIDAQLATLAPAGIDALAAEHAKIANELARLPAAALQSVEPVAELETALRAARTTLQASRTQVAALHAKQAKVRETEVALRARIDERRRQREVLEQQLPPDSERAQRLAALTTARDAAEAAVNEAVRSVQAWQEKAPDAARLTALQTAVAAAEAAHANHGRDLSRIAAEIARIEGELSILRNEDAATTAEMLTGELADVTDEISRLEDDIKALQLLNRELTAERDAMSSQFLAPVTARLQPYLDRVLPGAALDFDPDLAPVQLTRGGLAEPLDRLSDGTREQIAVLARLAFARLLAESGKPVPLILDDALVYADDERIAGMFEALTEAAQSHQVLVLSCRSRAFEGLGGRRIALTSWAPA